MQSETRGDEASAKALTAESAESAEKNVVK